MRPFVAAALLLAFAAGCRDAERPTPVRALTPDSVRYAQGFRLWRGDGYRVAEVRSGAAVARYVLVPRGVAVPRGEAGTVVRVPAERLVALSTTYLGFVTRVGADARVVAVAGRRWVNAPGVLARLDAGAALDVGETPGAEGIASARPDVVLLGPTEAAGPLGDQLATLGIAAVAVADYAEATPLGRAEWLRFVGLLVGREAEADAAFDSVAARYERLAARARPASPRPTVLLNAPYAGTWFVPGGRSFASAFLRDAGAESAWADDTLSAARPLSFEQILARAGTAAFWLHPGTWTRLADGARDEPRVRLFESFRAGRVWNNDARKSTGGGFDFHETGVAEPDVILADLVSIFHPALVPGHRRVYYRALPE